MKRTTCRKQNRVTRRKSRSSRKKCKRHQYTKRGGDKPATMSESLMKSFPAMANFPSCGTCLNAIEKNSLRKKKTPTKKKSTSASAKSKKTQDVSWDGWTTAELLDLGVVANEPENIETPANLTALEDSINFKTPSISNTKSTKQRNPFGRGYRKSPNSSK